MTKPVESIIKKNKFFFGNLDTIEDVQVYGLSLSDVDLPYIEKIASVCKDILWEFSDYDGENESKIIDFVNSNKQSSYTIITLGDKKVHSQLKFQYNEE